MLQQRNPAYNAYREAQVAARKRAAALATENLRRIDAILADYGRQLSSFLLSLGTSPTDRMIREATLKSTALLNSVVRPKLAALIATGRTTSFDEILGLQRETALAVAAAHDIPGYLLGAVAAPRVSLAGAFESLGTAATTWKTLLPVYVGAAAAGVQHIVTSALISGMSADELARRLRPVVMGAEAFGAAFKGTNKEIAAAIQSKPGLVKAAATLRYNADRIAFTEIHNARAEAEVQAFIADPLVAAVAWRLSPNRGSQKQPDVCDGLAKSDLYGLGQGVYPVTKVPLPPHPFDRCERVPITRPASQADQPKPNPPRQRERKVQGTGCT